MVKKVNALKARQNLGQLMNEVSLKEDDYIIERAGKPIVAIISIDKYRRLEEEKNKFFEWVDEIRDRTKEIDPKDIEKAVDEAVTAVREPEN